MNKPLRSDPRSLGKWMTQFILLLLPVMGFSQDCENDIMILGSNYVCENSTESYTLEQTFPGQVGNWYLVQGGAGTFLTPTTGNAVDIVWNGGDGVFDLVVEFTDYQAGCVGTFDDTLTIEVVSDFGLQLACNDTVQVSLGTDCQATIFPDMVLEGGRVTNEDYNVHVIDANGDTIPNAVIDGAYIGQILEVSIEHDCSGNSCWGYLRIEDKIGPNIECTDVMVDCTDDTDPVFGGVPGFPFDPTGVSVTPNGTNEFIVNGLDSCGPVSLSYIDDEEAQNCIGGIVTTTLYGVTRAGSDIFELDTSDASVINSVPMTLPGETIIGSYGLATDPSTNELYVLLEVGGVNGAVLGIVDPASGLVNRIAELDANEAFASMTFNGLGDVLYMVTGNNGANPNTVFEVDKYSGASTPICDVSAPVNIGQALGFNSFTDELNHLTALDDTMRIVDVSTCTQTGVSLSGTVLHGDSEAPAALSFDATRGDFMLSENAGLLLGTSTIYRLGPDGQVQLVGAFGAGIVKGLAFVRTTPFIHEITRTWTIEDQSGNTDQCVQTIDVRPQSLLQVVCPPNYDDLEEDALTCDGGWAEDSNGHPSPTVTGFPTGVECENLDYDYVDYRLGICENSYKIVREWLIADWCTGQQIYCNQIIKVIDKDGPQVTANEPCVQLLSSDPFDCQLSSYLVPEPILDINNANGSIQNNPYVPVVIDECGSYTYTVRHKVADVSVTDVCDCANIPANTVFDTRSVRQVPGGQYELTNIPVGCNWIEYIFTDDCGNETSYTIDIFVEEDRKPVAICDQHTVVTLSTTGTAKVFASTFDDGSYDNCEIDSFAVRRMFPGNCPTGVAADTSFRGFVEFCCADAGPDPIMVVFRAYDKSGNYNECMVEVTVVDKNAPELECPPNIVVSCEYNFTDINVFGNVVMNEADRNSIIIDDPSNPNVPRNNNWGLDGIYSDDCVADTSYSEVDNRNDCGVGQIRRTWTVVDGNTTRSCTQTITFTDFVPFDGTGIVFPSDRSITSCPSDVDPDVTGRPILPNTGTCADLLVSYTDEVYNIVPDACYKILRTWTVLDWCNNNQNTNKFTDVQVIKILNTQDPYFVTPCKDTTFYTITNSNCTGIATLEVEVEDDCTPDSDLIVSYRIDLDRDGSIDLEQTGDSNLSATNTYPKGTHEICWTVEDKCGNQDVCCYDFTMEDGKKPTPYCKPGIVTVVMPSSGMIDIWASDFDDGSFDNCTDPSDLRFSFSPRTSDTRRVYTCDSLENGIEESFEVTVYVTDLAGNQDFCVTRVVIQDGVDDVCPDNITGNMVNVSGSIVTEDAETVEEVMVTLDDQTSGIPKYNMTDVDGQYAFPSIPSDHIYTIAASRNDDHLNGVSTLDLVMIQRHLLGMTSFNSPYKHIAADANNSNSVSAADISELRKLILGRYAELPNNESWRFVAKGFQFADPTSPWPFEEIMEIDDMGSHASANDFIAIKTGDINGDAAPNSLIGNVVRSSGELVINGMEQDLTEGEMVQVTLSANADEIFGLQFALQFDPSQLQLADIQHVAGITHDGHIGLTQLQDGVILVSWNAPNGEAVSIESGLISFVFEAFTDGKLSEVIGLNTKRLTPEAYLTDMQVVDVTLNLRSEDGKVVASSEEFALYQNQPNPFDGTTTIAFKLPRMEEASIHIFDVTGKTVHLINGVFAKGKNEVTVGRSELKTSGVLYYRLETNDQMATRKMIMIE